MHSLCIVAVHVGVGNHHDKYSTLVIIYALWSYEPAFDI